MSEDNNPFDAPTEGTPRVVKVEIEGVYEGRFCRFTIAGSVDVDDYALEVKIPDLIAKGLKAPVLSAPSPALAVPAPAYVPPTLPPLPHQAPAQQGQGGLPDLCPVHGTKFFKNEKNGKTWFSHRYTDPNGETAFCNKSKVMGGGQ